MQNQKSKIKNQKSGGVTLIELVVVLAIFMIVMVITVSIFISMAERQKNILEEQEILNQTSYVAEYMSRTIRTAKIDEVGKCLSNNFIGYNYLLTHYNLSEGFYQGIEFISGDDVCLEFFLDSDGVLKEVKNKNTPQSILSSKFTIKYLRFIINGDKTLQGTSKNDLVQPRITMILDIITQETGGQKERIFQTTVSQRNLNIENSPTIK